MSHLLKEPPVMKRFLLSLFAFCCGTVPIAAAELSLTLDGQPQAEIILADKPPRSTRLAAHELQTYVEKISGAKLPIVSQPSGTHPVKIYIGQSSHTDRLKITTQGLQYGAYRIVSGPDWLVLIGDDKDFTPIEPWAKNNDDIVERKTQGEWEKIAGAPWGAPNILMYKNHIRLSGDIGRPTAELGKGKADPLELWCYDERGSFNAVNGFLYRLGARWYLPGDLGEVLPSLKTIPLPRIDETVRPDFPLRRFSFRFGATNGHDSTMWSMRLRMRDPFDIQDAHGLDTMTHRDEIFALHPEWFALYGGKRNYAQNQVNCQLCYSNEELLQETVRYVRTQFDHYGSEMVSVMPPDGYGSICQCKLCEGKDSPDRPQAGLLSDYVWDFVNRVAKEVGKTHPRKKVLNCAYGVYTLPPLRIAKLEPNVVVSIVGGRRPLNSQPKLQEECRQLREAWVAKTENPLIVFENYPFIDRGWYLPAYLPHILGDSINATKGQSHGEDISLTTQGFDKNGVGFNHFMVYFTAQMYWGGKDQNADAIFREYCHLFYGPAEKEMHAFFTFCEANWDAMEKDKSKTDTALALFAAAQKAVTADSVYGRRVALIDDFLKGLRSKSVQLAKKRGPVPQLRLVGEITSKIVIDGKLDDEAWVNCPVASTCRLSELQTGRPPVFGTTVKSAWRGNDLYFAIRCDEHPGEKLNICTKKNDDGALWHGDVVELLLETEARSYYQLAINPAGAIADLDRSAAAQAWFSWDSQAEIAPHVADDHWTVEVRIPVTQDENDPLHQVIGRKPDNSLPWHINICRQRIREHAAEYSAFSPTGEDHFHALTKFAHFYDGNSFQFDAGSPDADYLDGLNAGTDFARRGKYADALRTLTAVADGKATDLQKSVALEQAAAAARQLRQHDVASELAGKIPVDSVKKTVLMLNLLDQFKAQAVTDQFANEDINAWPFWKAGDGFYTRGRAYSIMKNGQSAERDLLQALEWTSDRRMRDSIHLELGINREANLKDEVTALKAYRAVVEDAKHLGSAHQLSAVQGSARILTRSGKFDPALAVLSQVELDKIGGYWRANIRLSIAETQTAAGRKADAIATCKSILADTTLDPRLLQRAEEALAKLQQ